MMVLLLKLWYQLENLGTDTLTAVLIDIGLKQEDFKTLQVALPRQRRTYKIDIFKQPL
jgi:hypothetical protein